MESPDRLLTPAEVALKFRVDPRTVSAWARTGKLPAVRTIGGRYRFRASDVDRFLTGRQPEDGAA